MTDRAAPRPVHSTHHFVRVDYMDWRCLRCDCRYGLGASRRPCEAATSNTWKETDSA